VVGQGAVVGEGPEGPPNRQEPGRLNTGITVVGKRAMIPRGQRVGRNVKIGLNVRTADFQSRNVRSGDSVVRPEAAAQARTPASAKVRSAVAPPARAGAADAAG